MGNLNSIKLFRSKKKMILTVLFAFIAISQFAFFHHVLVEKHGIHHVEEQTKSEAHDHCTSSTIANPNILLFISNFTPFVDIHSSIYTHYVPSISITKSSHIYLRGPPVS